MIGDPLYVVSPRIGQNLRLVLQHTKANQPCNLCIPIIVMPLLR